MDSDRSLHRYWKKLSVAHHKVACSGVVDSGWWTVARNGERRKTNVEKSKRESLGGSFALSPWPAPWPFFLAHLSLLFPNSLKACYRLTTCIPSFSTYDIYWTWASSTFGALSLISRNRFGGTNFSTAFRLWKCHFFLCCFLSFILSLSVSIVFLDVFFASLPSRTHLPPPPPFCSRPFVRLFRVLGLRKKYRLFCALNCR